MMQIVIKPIFAAIRFLQEVRMEMRKVNWLSRRDAMRLTAVVFLFSLITSIYLGAIDYLLNFLLGKFIF